VYWQVTGTGRFGTLNDEDFKGKRVLVRVDFNVPMIDGKVSDDTRIRAAEPTINQIAGSGGRVVLLSHFGRPKDGPEPKYSLKPLLPAVAAIVGRPIAFADDCIGPTAKAAVDAMKDGYILVL
jgi:phosphoglycerate kinase